MKKTLLCWQGSVENYRDTNENIKMLNGVQLIQMVKSESAEVHQPFI